MTDQTLGFFEGTEMPTTGWWEALWPDPSGVLASAIAAIAADLGLSQSALSQHLAKLRKSGAIKARRAGHNFFYRIADARVTALLIALHEVLKAREGCRSD